MDLDHLYRLVLKAIDESSTLNDTGPAYDDLLAYLNKELPEANRISRLVDSIRERNRQLLAPREP